MTKQDKFFEGYKPDFLSAIGNKPNYETVCTALNNTCVTLQKHKERADFAEKLAVEQTKLILQAEAQEKKLREARPIDEWHEDYGDALWWAFPIEESPYCGNPLASDWPGYHTHWTPFVVPDKEEEAK
ncbi:hypothetical protein EHV15_05265 [Paenibacillus oralis]|uniref:DUF551 domain-containing protein n=1 Tax=Paenibacillus oralis TaxID=2490856 RepID=A0A3P3TXA6_9BACL|nr:hypothetical protein [Paenibacillus oralis]RRJ62424.1 hypothetical protein EHV15_05265 [Paenibacillus oralis]